MLPDRVSNSGPLTYESDALPIALRGPAGHSILCKSCDLIMLTLEAPGNKYSSIGPDEVAHNELPHLELHCLPSLH